MAVGRFGIVALGIVALALSGGGAPAQEAMGEGAGAAVHCTGAAPLPPELAGWTDRHPEHRAPNGDADLITGRAVEARLQSVASLHYRVSPEKHVNPASYSGVFRFHISRAGVYRIALGGPAWIDVVDSGAIVPSLSHAHGPDCSGIRKIVDFKLEKGTYFLQISGSAFDHVAVLITQRL